MNSTIINFGIFCLIAVAIAGCVGTGPGTPVTPTQTPTPTGTPVQVGHYVFTEEQNGATVYMNKSSTITLKLQENPTTGYSWNLTVTPGLTVTNDTYIPSDTSGTMVGSGGMHIWEMTASATGNQAMEGIYKRPWEPVYGNETTFNMTIIVQ
jgi:inhibitor of cysteine peptidase